MGSVEVCVCKPLRDPRKAGEVSVFRLLALRRDLDVPRTHILVVHDATGYTVQLGPVTSMRHRPTVCC